MIRTNLSVAVVAMTVPDPKVPNSTAPFNWNSKEKGTLLGAFFYGYLFTQIVGGWLSIKIGGAKVFGAGILVSSILAIVTPQVVPFGIFVFVGVRAAQGFVQVGAITCVWWLIWVIFVRDDPQRDPWISDEELEYLKSTLGESEHKDVISNVISNIGKLIIINNRYFFGFYCIFYFYSQLFCKMQDIFIFSIKHPWLKFFTSMPVWAIVVSHFCQNWGFYTMFTNLPSFFKETLHYDITMSGVLSSLPFLVMSVGLPIAGLIIDKIRRLGIFSITTIRKLFNCGAFLTQCGFMFMATRFQEPKILVVCLTFANGIGAFAWAAFGVNHLDIAPPHAGVLMGISNMMATFSGVFSTQLTGYVVVQKTLEEWNTIFLVSSGFYLLGALFYLIFGSGEKQSWVIDSSTTSKPTGPTRSPTSIDEEEDDDDEGSEIMS
ncbi:vesicular glutamate transporter 3-like [Planococcus citri]|uniref:vesicular glutamate transporter 3-like n=1 Tax=Planococcus citri TaxID=170843 RepID=UPI0031F89A37